MSSRTPEISAVVVTDSFSTIRVTVRHLVAQTVADRVELVVVAPSAEGLGLDAAACEGLHGVRVVELPDFESLPRARACGVRAASAPVVLMAETHSFPERRSLGNLIEAHRGPWAVVGQAICNANPGPISWSNLFMDYGPWVERRERGDVEGLPMHNSSYEREALLECGEGLDAMMVSSAALNGGLRARGYRLLFEPEARTFHLNVTQPVPWLLERMHGARAYAADRSSRWPLSRRALYALGAPLIPFVRLRRILRDVRRTGRTELLPRILPRLALALVASSFGEWLGYAFGPGDSPRRLYRYEIYRERYVRPADRPAAVAA